MFTVARFIVQHKVGAVAIMAIGVFFLTPSGDEEAEKSSNPWSAQAQASASSNRVVMSSDEGGFIDDMVDEAASMLDEAGLNPVAKADETVGQFESAADSLGDANK